MTTCDDVCDNYDFTHQDYIGEVKCKVVDGVIWATLCRGTGPAVAILDSYVEKSYSLYLKRKKFKEQLDEVLK